MLDGFLAAHPPVLADDAMAVAELIGELASLGVWTLGTDEAIGGGGADHAMTTVAWERLGRGWPALGWASVQAHVAVDVLGSDPALAELVAQLHAGDAAVAVVDARSAHVRITSDGAGLSGSVDRVDAASESPHLLILRGPSSAALVPPSAITSVALRRTGFSGALTRSLSVEADPSAVHVLEGVDTAAASMRLRLGAAAVAAGIAGAAVDAAITYTAGRRQFGAALTALPTVRQSLLTQWSGADVMMSAAMTGASDPVSAYAVLRSACDGVVDIAAAAVQSHGGYGYLTEYPVERHLRDAVSLRAAVDVWGAGRTAATALTATEESWQEAS
jgi:alkylation response protein AidB-like acyl-CoA dehydrogenase